MTSDVRNHEVPAAGSTPQRTFIDDLSLSINDVVFVANATERAQALIDIGSSASRPLIVRQADTSAYWEHNGSAWRQMFVAGAISAHASRATAATIVTATITTFGWDAPTLRGGITHSSGVFTVPVAGRYLVTIGLGFTAVANGFRSGWVLLNGATRVIEHDIQGSASSGGFVNGSRVLDLAAGDTLAVQVYQTSGSNLDVFASPIRPYVTIDFQGD